MDGDQVPLRGHSITLTQVDLVYGTRPSPALSSSYDEEEYTAFAARRRTSYKEGRKAKPSLPGQQQRSWVALRQKETRKKYYRMLKVDSGK